MNCRLRHVHFNSFKDMNSNTLYLGIKSVYHELYKCSQLLSVDFIKIPLLLDPHCRHRLVTKGTVREFSKKIAECIDITTQLKIVILKLHDLPFHIYVAVFTIYLVISESINSIPGFLANFSLFANLSALHGPYNSTKRSLGSRPMNR